MPAVTISSTELRAFAPDLDPVRAEALIVGALARAARIAPCITDPAFTFNEAARDIIRDVILRRAGRTNPGVTEETTGPYSAKYSAEVRFTPSEIAELQDLCTAFSGAPAAAPTPMFSMPDSPLADSAYRAAVYRPRCWPGAYE